MQAVKTYFQALAEVLPDYDAFFRPGASEDALAAQEAHFGVELPESYKALMRTHDGERYYLMAVLGYALLPLEESRVRSGGFYRETETDPKASPSEERPSENLHPEKVRDSFFLNRRIVVADSSGRASICLDYDPAPGGTPGQVIFVTQDFDAPIGWLADNFDAFLTLAAKAIRDRDMMLSDDRGGPGSEYFEAREDVFFEFMPGMTRYMQRVKKAAR